MLAINLKTEYLINPIGIDLVKPRLYWHCSNGIRQTAYRIVAEYANGTEAWDSGKVHSDSMSHIPYRGKPLSSRDVILWKVMLWDENEQPGDWSETASFEIGLLHKQDWTAKWITADFKPSRTKRYPVDCFKKAFISNAIAVKARLYITACGLYEASINGTKAGDQCFTPGFTDYRKRIQYQTIDVTDQIALGENTIEIELADGWYRGNIGANGFSHFYGNVTKFICQLEMIFADGTIQTIESDESFAWSNDGPLRFADLKDGEIFDAQRKPSYAGLAKRTACSVTPTASNNVAIHEKERFKPKLLVTPAGHKVLDLAQNIAGIIEFAVNAKKGQRVFLRFGEILDDNGEFTQANIQCLKPKLTPLQQVEFLCTDGMNHYKTRFAVFGFRYVLVDSDVELNPEDFTAIAVYSDLEQTGEFECSNKLINRFIENTTWSMKGNILDVPTDCPTRERAGWTGDAQIFCKTGSYLMNTMPFFRKWLNDLQDRQTKQGKVHCVVPSVGNELFLSRMDGCVGWADAAVLIPYHLSKMFGDKQLLHDCYPSMAKYMRFQISRMGHTGLFGKPFWGKDKKFISNVGQAFGEWLEPQEVYRQTIIKDFIAPHPEEATAYDSWVMGHMAEIAAEIGEVQDIPLYGKYRDGCKAAYNNHFVVNGQIDTDRQSKLVRPLALNLLEGSAKKTVQDRLVSSIEKRNYRIGTGFLSTPLILPLLTRMGRPDIAYRMMENEEQPGWLAQVKAGATTVWEDWEGHASQNHYSPGSVCEWLFEDVCGVRVAGENAFEIEPKPGGTLTHAKFTYKSMYGTVSCQWEKADKQIVYNVTVPENTKARIRLPDGTDEIKDAGIWEYFSK